MSSTEGPRHYEFHYVLHCPCGTSLSGDTEDDIVEVSYEHLREKHPHLAEEYTRDNILVMAVRLVK